MKQTFGYHDALIALSTIVSWADGERQDPEVDATIEMVAYERISEKTIEKYQQKTERITKEEDIFRLAIGALLNESQQRRANACAWMYKVALMASDKSTDVKGEHWVDSAKHLDQEELDWINQACKGLEVSEEDMAEAYKKLPTIHTL
ncbi:MAG: hypothetical protein GY827_12405 [Cytophagales bacterium]|nr:hypothetical protein [Cytophagales bacterium]